MAHYRFPVFFEAKELTETEKEKIERYFKIRRRSGGGECGPVEKVSKDTYKIAFLQQEDQERVLGPKKHIIPLTSDQKLEISTKQEVTLEEIKHVENEHEENEHCEVSQNHKAAPDTNEEKELVMDCYLTQFLQDNSNARQYLDQRLASLCKSFQILPEAGKVVLNRGSSLSGLPRCKWEIQVEDVNFHLQQKYHCYFEVDPARVKTLLQKNPVMCSENLCIYKEPEQDLAVVVGEHDEVEKMIKSLDAPQLKPQIQRDCGISSMQFTLVEESFISQMKVSFPHISISIKGSGDLAFEGPETEVEAACAKLQDLIKKVQQKRLQLPAPLLSFITSYETMQSYKTRFQRSLRSPVMLEVASDLVLSSLTTEALEEAAAALERDLTVETVVLDQAPGVVTLKEVLSEAVQQANHEAMKVELSYEQLSKSDFQMQVQIVGYRKEVDRLKDILLDYKLNQTDIHNFLSLPNAAVADHLFRVLELVGIQHGDLRLNTTKSPSLGVDFSGPRQLVQEFHRTLTSTLRFLVCREYSLEGPGALQYFSGEGKNAIVLLERSHNVLIFLSKEEKHSGAASSQPTSPISITNLTTTATTRPTPAARPSLPPVLPRNVTPTVTSGLFNTPNKIKLEVVMGHLEEQEVDVLVAPMLKGNLTSLRIGQTLAQIGGERLMRNFIQSIRFHKSVEPGDILQVEATPALRCQKIVFVECLPWHAASGNSEKALRCGLRQALTLCEQRALSSVAFPLIGPGFILKTPAKEAVSILTSEIGLFGLSGYTGALSTIRVVIHPECPDSKDIYRDVYSGLNLHTKDDKGQAVFQLLTSDPGEITMTVGGIQLHLVFGDITNETTDAIVNTTDFQNFESGLNRNWDIESVVSNIKLLAYYAIAVHSYYDYVVCAILFTAVCKSILSVAGLKVKKALKSAKVSMGEIFTSQPGNFPCKAIMHVCGEKNPVLIQNLTRDILLQCESNGYRSVAIPAICVAAGMDPLVVASAILSGVEAAVSSTYFQYLTTVRLVLFSMSIFQQFQAAADAMFRTPVRPKNTSVPHRASTTPVQPAPLYPDLGSVQFSSPSVPSSASSGLNAIIFPSLDPIVPPSAIFTLIGMSEEDVSSVCAGLEQAYTSHCSQHTLAPRELAGLSQAELQDLVSRVNNLGVQLEPSGQGSGAGVVVRGLKDGVKEVMHVVQESLRRQVTEKEQTELFTLVVWCIMGQQSEWERFPKEANQKLERGDVGGGVMDAHGCWWNVDVRRKQATSIGSVHVTLVKRLENLPDFKVPLYWDSLVPGQTLQVIPLIPLSAEFERVKADFRRTCLRTVLKIERVQNVYLRQAFEVQRQQLEHKNGAPLGAGEKMLYHGTTAQACQSIMKNGFNRGFAGQNATVYGVGTYFALNAIYSANPLYSRPEADGTQCMFVARVLAGSYTLGNSGMRVPPSVSPQQPHLRFDSLVDNMQSPSMFVVFHDSQAYPDYLITFK